MFSVVVRSSADSSLNRKTNPVFVLPMLRIDRQLLNHFRAGTSDPEDGLDCCFVRLIVGEKPCRFIRFVIQFSNRMKSLDPTVYIRAVHESVWSNRLEPIWLVKWKIRVPSTLGLFKNRFGSSG